MAWAAVNQTVWGEPHENNSRSYHVAPKYYLGMHNAWHYVCQADGGIHSRLGQLKP